MQYHIFEVMWTNFLLAETRMGTDACAPAPILRNENVTPGSRLSKGGRCSLSLEYFRYTERT
jgi:hypothetical protein